MFTGAQYGPGAPATLDQWLWTDEGKSTHIYVCEIPPDLAPGVHTVTVTSTDSFGRTLKEKEIFEVY
jgi:hypothetical protein